MHHQAHLSLKKNENINLIDNTNDSVITTVNYDHLVIACGAENATFGIPGVKENACFLKEAWCGCYCHFILPRRIIIYLTQNFFFFRATTRDARKIRSQLMDCLENAAFPGQSEDEVNRLLHMVVVGGGPTGVEYAAELYDFLHQDLVKYYTEHIFFFFFLPFT